MFNIKAAAKEFENYSRYALDKMLSKRENELQNAVTSKFVGSGRIEELRIEIAAIKSLLA